MKNKKSLLGPKSVIAITALMVWVNPYLGNAQSTSTFSNTGAITIPGAGTSGSASPYSSDIAVSGMIGYVSNVTVTLTGITHARPADIDVVLQSPSGVNVILMSDNHGTTAYPAARTYTFSDAASSALSNSAVDASGTYRPSNNDTNTDNWVSPGPGALSQASPSLSSLNNAAANGTWKLFVRDDQSARTGSISSGWSITITTSCNVTPSSSSNSPLCSGNDLNLSASGGVSYVWSGPASFSSTTQNPVITAAVTGNTGSYTVTVTDQYGCTANSNVSVTVHSSPVLSVSSSQNVTCYSGNDGQVELGVTGGQSAYSFTDGSSTNGTGIFGSLIAGSYNYTVTDANGCTDTDAATLTEPGAPSTAVAGSNQSLCNLTSTSLSADVPATGTGTWTVISGSASISDIHDPSASITSLVPGDLILRWTVVSDPCNTSYDEILIRNSAGVPAEPDTIYGTLHACPPANGETFYINSVAGADYYQWYVGPTTNGVTFTTATNDTSVTANFSSTTNSGYSIRVLAVNGCGTGINAGLFVRRTVSTPQLSGPSTLCASATGTYNIPAAIPGAVSYTWTVPAGVLINGSHGPFTSTSLSANITLPAVFTSGNVCVSATGPCGLTTTPRCITVRTTPARPSKMNGPFQVCPGSVEVYSTNAVNGATEYHWTVPANATIISGQGSQAVHVAFNGSFTGGTISVSVSNACATGSPLNKIVSLSVPDQPGNITGVTGGLCGNNAVSFTVPADPSCTFNWVLPAGASLISGAGTNSVSANLSGVSFPSVSNQYIQVCVSRTNMCGTSIPRCLNIQGVPSKPSSVSGPASVCQNQSGVSYSIPAVSGATSYIWTAPPGASVVSGQGTTSAMVNFGTAPGKVGVRAINACGHGGTRTIAVAISCREGMIESADLISVYPNPTDGPVRFSLDAVSFEAGDIRIAVSDLSGRVVYNTTAAFSEGDQELLVDLSSFENGTYLVQWSTGNKQGTERIVKY